MSSRPTAGPHTQKPPAWLVYWISQGTSQLHFLAHRVLQRPRPGVDYFRELSQSHDSTGSNCAGLTSISHREINSMWTPTATPFQTVCPSGLQTVHHASWCPCVQANHEGPEAGASGPSFFRGFLPLKEELHASPHAASGDARTDAAQLVLGGISFSASAVVVRGAALPRKQGNGRSRSLRPSSNFPSLRIAD
jgi:hypothetical protein